MSCLTGETPPTKKRKRKVPDEPFTKNVLVLRNGKDVTRSPDGVVFMPNTTLDVSNIKKAEKGQFKKLSFRGSMTGTDVQTLLEGNFPFLHGQRFYCASAADNRTRLDFHGEHPWIWSGNEIKKKVAGNSALYIFSEENHMSESEKLMRNLHISDSVSTKMVDESDTSDSGFETPGVLCRDMRAGPHPLPPPDDVQVLFPINDELKDTYKDYSSTDDSFNIYEDNWCFNQEGNPQGATAGNWVRDDQLEENRQNATAGNSSIVNLDDQLEENSQNATAENSSIVNSLTDVQQEETHQIATAENLVQEIVPTSDSLKGGKKFIITLSKELPDGISSGKVMFGDNQVRVTKLNSFALTGYIPSAQQAGEVEVLVYVYGDAEYFLGITHFLYEEDEMVKVANQVANNPEEMAKFFGLLSQQCLAKRTHSSKDVQNTAARQPGQVDSFPVECSEDYHLLCGDGMERMVSQLIEDPTTARQPGQVDSFPVECSEDYHLLFEDDMERMVSQLIEDPTRMSKLFSLFLSQQCDIKRMDSNVWQNAVGTEDEPDFKNDQLPCSCGESDDNESYYLPSSLDSDYLADIEISSCSSLDSVWSYSEDEVETDKDSICENLNEASSPKELKTEDYNLENTGYTADGETQDEEGKKATGKNGSSTASTADVGKDFKSFTGQGLSSDTEKKHLKSPLELSDPNSQDVLHNGYPKSSQTEGPATEVRGSYHHVAADAVSHKDNHDSTFSNVGEPSNPKNAISIPENNTQELNTSYGTVSQMAASKSRQEHELNVADCAKVDKAGLQGTYSLASRDEQSVSDHESPHSQKANAGATARVITESHNLNEGATAQGVVVAGAGSREPQNPAQVSTGVIDSSPYDGQEPVFPAPGDPRHQDETNSESLTGIPFDEKTEGTINKTQIPDNSTHLPLMDKFHIKINTSGATVKDMEYLVANNLDKDELASDQQTVATAWTFAGSRELNANMEPGVSQGVHDCSPHYSDLVWPCSVHSVKARAKKKNQDEEQLYLRPQVIDSRLGTQFEDPKRIKEESLSMATTTYQSTKDVANNARQCLLLIDGGTHILREIFDKKGINASPAKSKTIIEGKVGEGKSVFFQKPIQVWPDTRTKFQTKPKATPIILSMKEVDKCNKFLMKHGRKPFGDDVDAGRNEHLPWYSLQEGKEVIVFHRESSGRCYFKRDLPSAFLTPSAGSRSTSPETAVQLQIVDKQNESCQVYITEESADKEEEKRLQVIQEKMKKLIINLQACRSRPSVVFLTHGESAKKDGKIREENDNENVQYVVIADYKMKKKDKKGISLKAGDIVNVIERDDFGWWLVHRDGELGWAPASHLEPVDDRAENTSSKTFAPGRGKVGEGKSVFFQKPIQVWPDTKTKFQTKPKATPIILSMKEVDKCNKFLMKHGRKPFGDDVDAGRNEHLPWYSLQEGEEVEVLQRDLCEGRAPRAFLTPAAGSRSTSPETAVPLQIVDKQNESCQVYSTEESADKEELEKRLQLLQEKLKETSHVLSLLKFRKHGGVVYRSIEEAFPDAVIAETVGMYQQTRPIPPYALISIAGALTQDGRFGFLSRGSSDDEKEELAYLSNRSVRYTSNSIQLTTLPVQNPSSEDDVGDVVLVGFGSRPIDYGRYQAVCEGVILLSSAQSTDEADTRATIPDPPMLNRYNMSSNPRGLCLIINNLAFQDEKENRNGGHFDEEKLANLFTDLSFEVEIAHDLRYSEIMDKAEEYGSRDHSDFDAFIMIVMSHGIGDSIYGVSGKSISVKELMAEFKVDRCPSLCNKPKIFIFQTCRKFSNNNMVRANGSNKKFKVDSTMVPDSTLPLSVTPPEADFLLAFSTAPGYLSWRDEDSGSLYVQVLVDAIRELHEHCHLLDILTEVNHRVAERAANEIDSEDIQIPAPVYTLRRQLFL